LKNALSQLAKIDAAQRRQDMLLYLGTIGLKNLRPQVVQPIGLQPLLQPFTDGDLSAIDALTSVQFKFQLGQPLFSILPAASDSLIVSDPFPLSIPPNIQRDLPTVLPSLP
jgi:hypothetical protein